MFVFLVIVGGMAAAFAYAVTWNRKVDEAWHAAGTSLGLTFSGNRSLSGTTNGRNVSIDTVTRGSGKNRKTFTRVRVQCPFPASQLEFTSESMWTRLKRFVGADDVVLGDDAFDRAVHVKGPEDVARATLNAGARRRVANAMQLGAFSEGNTLVVEWNGIEADVSKLVGTARELISTANALDLGRTSVPQALARNAVEDERVEVRIANFEAYARVARADELPPVARRLLASNEPPLQIAAARVLGDDDSFAALDAILDSVGRPDDRLAALEALFDVFPYARCRPALDVALRTGRPPLRLRALEIVEKFKDVTLLEPVLRCVSLDDDALVTAAAAALGAMGDTSAETTLIPLLSHASPARKLAAARALRTCGTVAAVEPLLPLTKGLFADGALKSAALEAIRKIQSGLRHADAGRLSVSAHVDDGGALSVAQDAGGLSLEEAGDDAPVTGPARVRG